MSAETRRISYTRYATRDTPLCLKNEFFLLNLTTVSAMSVIVGVGFLFSVRAEERKEMLANSFLHASTFTSAKIPRTNRPGYSFLPLDLHMNPALRQI